jgi:hypothetical protein
MFNCFNCGAPLPLNSLRCKECGYCPDINFMRRCPNLKMATCHLTGNMCDFREPYQTCPIKNKAESEAEY